MTTKRFRKEDVETYGDHGRSYPSVNVKVYKSITNLKESDLTGDVAPEDVAPFHEWLMASYWEEEGYEALPEWLFDSACESEAEYVKDWILTEEDALFPEAKNVWFMGRQGGHLCVEGLSDVESWDAIMVSRWGKLARIAREIADGIPLQMAVLAYLNIWRPMEDAREEEENAEKELEEARY